ncbi:MAG: metalloregulator ArsR/SmtB family transcription factor [Actinomycetota bacterium]
MTTPRRAEARSDAEAAAGTGERDVAAIGALIGDRTRAAFLLALLGGTPLPASVLAERAGVSRPLASAHLRKLTEGGLVRVEPRGRQRLYRLAGEPVATALEALAVLSPPEEIRSLRASVEAADLRYARLCFDHLAGVLGVALADRLVAEGLLEGEAGGYGVTDAGRVAFSRLGVAPSRLARDDRERPLTRACRDWSEGRFHLAGSLGAALTARMLGEGWLRVREGTRIVRVTPAGRTALHRAFGLEPDALRAGSPG